MSGGGGGYSYPLPTIQNTSSSTTIPGWLTNASQFGVNNARRMLSQPVQGYTGQMSPGLSDDQQSAGDMIRGSVGAYQPYYDQAAAMTQASTGMAPNVRAGSFGMGLQGAINNYMNPYISNVVDSVNALGQQNLANSLNQTADQAIGAKAFGGSRHGVQEGIATAQNNLNTNNLLANLLSSGYTQATGLMGQDINNNLQAQVYNQANANTGMNRMQTAGNQMSNLGTANRAANTADISNLMNYGTLQQQTTGAQQQAAYNEWLRQQNMPLQMQQVYNQTVGAAPHDTSTNTSSVGISPVQQQSSSPLMSGLGMGLAGLSTVGGLFSAPAGGMSAVNGLLSMIR